MQGSQPSALPKFQEIGTLFPIATLWPFFAVVFYCGRPSFLSIFKGREPMPDRTFGKQTVVKRWEKGVVGWLAREKTG